MKLPTHSIRWRVQLWHGLALLAAIAALCAVTWQLVWQDHVRRIDQQLFEAERTLVRGLLRAAEPQRPVPSREKDGGRPPMPAELLRRLNEGHVELDAVVAARFEGRGPGRFWFVFADSTGRRLLESGHGDAPGFPPLDRPDLDEELRFVGDARESLHHNPVGLWSVVGRDIRPEREEMRRFGLGLGGAGLGLWALGLLGGWWLAGRAIRPIDAISRTAARIAEDHLEERVPVSGGRSELDRLAVVLNGTFDRLQASLERQRRFTADASHELRTPLTVILAETQRAGKRERSAEEYREILATCHQAGLRMRSLVEDLLLLARQEDGRETLRLVSCRLDERLSEVVGGLRPLAERLGLRLETELVPTTLVADPVALATVADNLVGNALQHHGRPGGVVRVSCGSDGTDAVFAVEDDGPGIAAEHLPRLFERFYRVDAARGAGEGHSGLGLAIVQALVEAHGGHVTVASQAGDGARFEVRLPLGG